MIAHRFWSQSVPVFYVSAVKPGLHKRGAVGDWEYTTDITRACNLTKWEAMHFRADCNAVGAQARFIHL